MTLSLSRLSQMRCLNYRQRGQRWSLCNPCTSFRSEISVGGGGGGGGCWLWWGPPWILNITVWSVVALRSWWLASGTGGSERRVKSEKRFRWKPASVFLNTSAHLIVCSNDMGRMPFVACWMLWTLGKVKANVVPFQILCLLYNILK